MGLADRGDVRHPHCDLLLLLLGCLRRRQHRRHRQPQHPAAVGPDEWLRLR
ncbi:hypothetical protein [Ornithinimicrobium kibberense]|uniref:hypothetical protein n=1 Tax=Ornithinimicrobium kibberense TaxID=282060 RepID=UPI00360B57F4